ncbi:DNA alkylation repair protein [Telluribacter sp.]|jgi:3-methyladenine DNA glycosylase AlkD|uniref:DNA alkylation repair protein n=1 Tax=Telluribacter sp. TaxID=1978767 RepID=UPI002E0E0628|nr:DNA alkylation repair protein [Telluribacter sp.]
MDLVQGVRADLRAFAAADRAAFVAGYFQTGPGQYAEGDQFWGVSNPQVRQVARQWRTLPADQLQLLLRDPVHECRLAALLIMVDQFAKAKEDGKHLLYEMYLSHLDYINNWDLVDASARDIVGRYLYDKDRSSLLEMARQPHLWTQRVAIVATHYYIRKGQYADTLAVAGVLLSHKHHLIHKAVGWMLREVGNRDLDTLEEFLHHYIGGLPRTTLRYAIERLPPARRQYYLTL